jgi:hypothetical protein
MVQWWLMAWEGAMNYRYHSEAGGRERGVVVVDALDAEQHARW